MPQHCTDEPVMGSHLLQTRQGILSALKSMESYSDLLDTNRAAKQG